MSIEFGSKVGMHKPKLLLFILSILCCFVISTKCLAVQEWNVGNTSWVYSPGELTVQTKLVSTLENNSFISRLICRYGLEEGDESSSQMPECPEWLDGRAYIQIEGFNLAGMSEDNVLGIEYVVAETGLVSGEGPLDAKHCSGAVLGQWPEDSSATVFSQFLNPAALTLQGDDVLACDNVNVNLGDGNGYYDENGFTDYPTFDFVKADAPGWVEYIVFLEFSQAEDEEEMLFTGMPQCSKDTIDNLGDWLGSERFEVNIDPDGSITVTTPSPFECITFKIPMTTAEEDPGTVQLDGSDGLQATLNFDGAFTGLTIDAINDNWSAQIGVRPGTDKQGVGCGLESTCHCADSLCLEEFFSVADFNLQASEAGSSSNDYTSARYPSELIYSDCGEGQPEDIYYIQLIGKNDYAGLDVSAPLLLDWDGDGFEEEPLALCDLISAPGFECEALDCSDSCNLEACMACQLDCTRTDWDCDDSESLSYPSANEICDGLDNDCDQVVDESLTAVYPDRDGDGFGGNEAADCAAAEEGVSYVQVAGDCDDNSALIYPNAPSYLLQDTETGELIDNDCVPGVAPWQEALMDTDYDGFAESLLVDVQHPLGLGAIVELMGETYRAVQTFGLPHSQLQIMDALFLSPGVYSTQLMVSAFKLELRAEPGTVLLRPESLNCEQNCLSTIVAVDGADLFISGLMLEEGQGTSDSAVEQFRAQSLEDILEEETPEPQVLERNSSDEAGYETDEDDLKPTPTDFPDLPEFESTSVPKPSVEDDTPGATPTPEPPSTGPTPTPGYSTPYILEYCSGEVEYVDDLRWGGSILAYDSRLIIENTIFSLNQAHMGAAIALVGGTQTSRISNSSFVENIVLDPKWSSLAPVIGTVYVEASTLELFDNVLSNNKLDTATEYNPATGLFEPLEPDCVPHSGAALGIYYGNVTAANNVFSNNVADYGGAISALGMTQINTLNFYNNTIEDNLSFLGGGALVVFTLGTDDEASLQFHNNIVSGNRSYGIAGGALIMGSKVDFTNNLISANVATSYGGLLFIGYQFQELSHLTFDRNRSLSHDLDGSEGLTLSDVSMFPVEYVVESVENEVLLEDEIASTLQLFRDVQTAKVQLPTHNIISAKTQAMVMAEGEQTFSENIDGSYHMSNSVITTTAPIEWARSCDNDIEYEDMVWLPYSPADHYECTQPEAWLRLASNPYQAYSVNLDWAVNDYHLAELVEAVNMAATEPKTAEVEDYDISELGVYSGVLSGREAGAFHNKCLGEGDGFVAHLSSTQMVEQTLSVFDKLVQWSDGSESRQDVYVLYLNRGQRLTIDVVAEQFSPSVMVQGPEALSFKRDETTHCDLDEVLLGSGGHLQFVAEQDGYHSIFVGAIENLALGPYSLSTSL